MTTSDSPLDVIGAADIIYTDCWPSPSEDRDSESIEDAFAPLRITGGLLAKAGPQALFLPCPPVTRGEEVSSDAMDDPRCRVVEAKSWLLDAQAALLAELITPNL